MSLFKNAFKQRCYKIKTSPLLHTLVACFFFLLSLIAFPFCLQIFLGKVFGKKPKLLRTHICRASLQGKSSDVCFVCKGSGHHKYVSSGVQEMDGLCFKQLNVSFLPAKSVVSWCCGHQWRNTKDWKDTEQYPHHNTKANWQ